MKLELQFIARQPAAKSLDTSIRHRYIAHAFYAHYFQNTLIDEEKSILRPAGLTRNKRQKCDSV